MFLALDIFFLILGALEIFNPPISKKLLSFFSLLPAFILTAFRHVSVGSDTYAYSSFFLRVSSYNSLFDAIHRERVESGYVILNYFFSYLGLNYYHFQFFVSLVIYITFFYIISKYSKNIGLSCFVFLSLRLMFGPMNVIRMYLAVASLLCSLPFIQNRKFFHFFFCVLLATMFHKSAFVFLLLYPLSKIELEKKIVFSAIAAASALALVGKGFFLILTSTLGLYGNYLKKVQFNTEGKIAIFFILAIDICFALFIWYNESKYKENVLSKYKDKEIVPISKICKISVLVIICLDIIGLCNTIMGRITGYFSFCWLILIPMAFSLINNKAKAFIVYIFFVFFLLVQFQLTMVYRPNWNCVEPYRFCFGELF